MKDGVDAPRHLVLTCQGAVHSDTGLLQAAKLSSIVNQLTPERKVLEHTFFYYADHYSDHHGGRFSPFFRFRNWNDDTQPLSPETHMAKVCNRSQNASGKNYCASHDRLTSLVLIGNNLNHILASAHGTIVGCACMAMLLVIADWRVDLS